MMKKYDEKEVSLTIEKILMVLFFLGTLSLLFLNKSLREKDNVIQERKLEQKLYEVHSSCLARTDALEVQIDKLKAQIRQLSIQSRRF